MHTFRLFQADAGLDSAEGPRPCAADICTRLVIAAHPQLLALAAAIRHHHKIGQPVMQFMIAYDN